MKKSVNFEPSINRKMIGKHDCMQMNYTIVCFDHGLITIPTNTINILGQSAVKVAI